MHWTEDRFWTDALERYIGARERNETQVLLDLGRIERSVFDVDGPAYRCMHAMGSVLEHEAQDGYRGAPRILLALLFQLAEPCSVAMPGGRSAAAGTVSLSPPVDPVMRRSVRVLAMVHELHKAGYQRLRICAGHTLDLRHWRCHIGPATTFHSDGWTPVDGSRLLTYSTSRDQDYFGWSDTKHDDARSLAMKFLERHPDLAREAAGEDWAYSGWFSRILGNAEQGVLPEFFGGRLYHLGEEPTQSPPPLINCEPYPGTGQPLIPHYALRLDDIPADDADLEELWRFCLSIDGYRACRLAGADPHHVTSATLEQGLQSATLESLRITAFMLQRTLKWGDACPPDPKYLEGIRRIVDTIRTRLSVDR